MRAVRQAISPDDRGILSDRIATRLFELPALGAARAVLLFYSFGSEVTTREISRRLLTEGRRVLLPFLEGSDRMEAAELRPGRPPVATTYGPKEPADRAAVDPEDVDLVVAPGLAFDRMGYRLGYGGGHYDRYLARLGPHATRVGIAFHVQVRERIPSGPDDQRLDFVVTERETIDCQAGDVPDP
jgi:5-formyltetrahydrofolate cyclo-ligase